MGRTYKLLIAIICACFFAFFAFVLVNLTWGATAADRQAIIDAFFGKKPTAPAPATQVPATPTILTPEVKSITTSCPKVDTGWRPQLPMVIKGWATITFDGGVYLAGIRCRMCHAIYKIPCDPCENWTVARDGRWTFRGTTLGYSHQKHFDAGVPCAGCHRIE